MKNIDNLSVFIKKWPFNVENEDIYPQKRKKEIEKCSNFDIKNQKFFAWKLLEEGCEKLGCDFDNLTFFKDGDRWSCKEFFFSLSHSGNIVVAAISKHNVGVDIEKVNHNRFAKFSADKFLTESEKEGMMPSGENFNRLWTKKEAIFKLGGFVGFNPCKIDSNSFKSETKTLIADGEKFYISVAAEQFQNVKYVLGEGIDFEDKD